MVKLKTVVHIATKFIVKNLRCNCKSTTS